MGQKKMGKPGKLMEKRGHEWVSRPFDRDMSDMINDQRLGGGFMFFFLNFEHRIMIPMDKIWSRSCPNHPKSGRGMVTRAARGEVFFAGRAPVV